MQVAAATGPRNVVVRSYVGYCDWQASDKEYVILLVHVVGEGVDPAADEPDDAKTWMVLVAYGPAGSLREGKPPQSLETRKVAEKTYESKVKEKAGAHHYTPLPGLPFAGFAKYFKEPLTLPDGTAVEEEGEPELGRAVAAVSVTAADPRYAGCTVVQITWEEFHTLCGNSLYGKQEKDDGEYCSVACDGLGEDVQAYNRHGELQHTAPEVAKALTSLKASLLVAGEKLVGLARKGQYTIFDLLEWMGQDIRSWPYQQRIATLQRAMKEAGLIREERVTPTVREALANSTVPGLALLTCVVEEQEVAAFVEAVRQQGGEGYIIRSLAAAYMDAKAVLKRKFRNDIDLFVTGIKPGANGGSLELGQRRPSDNAVLAAGHVRAGLKAQDMHWFKDRLAQREERRANDGDTFADDDWDVVTVELFTKGSKGIIAVQGVTSIERVRSDKSAFECTTDQWGEAKAELVRQAKPARGLYFRPRS